MEDRRSSFLKLYLKMKDVPLGKYMLATAVCFKTPFCSAISPYIDNIFDAGSAEAQQSGFIRTEVSMPNRRAVQNHLPNGAVHASALCSLVEFCFGLLMEAAIRPPLRWIPDGMDISYLKVANGSRLLCSGTLPVQAVSTWDEQTEGGAKVHVKVPISICNTRGEEVCFALVRCQVSRPHSNKPTRPTQSGTPHKVKAAL
mmetsp:Transcript_16736/g.32589  ORF Transcript_16736/g.32589 Transcript_16736/m.32589 type:complete len:200 (-) Transcript_16736:170-769(-)|eukprot:CAMPEP_0175179548 /NCGR_PEP_ID=MMETSP0087-20121206/35577_1 /TAXON_ID=136419 /ORGANISM="Unknown Unknown, Strain D1" /LENGTH=199 /DNA_ID=CAMNT_0016471797 /DNA_START=34 /DNA_END=633 /DNA_ORIENTATION=-